MEGSFLVRQIYEDDLTYNLITAAVEVLRKSNMSDPTGRSARSLAFLI